MAISFTFLHLGFKLSAQHRIYQKIPEPGIGLLNYMVYCMYDAALGFVYSPISYNR